MSSIIIPNEWKEENPFVYYSLQLWHNSKTYANQEYEYSSCSDCVSSLKSRLSMPNNHIEMATIREHIIYKRTSNIELSTSSPLFHYDYKTGYRI